MIRPVRMETLLHRLQKLGARHEVSALIGSEGRTADVSVRVPINEKAPNASDLRTLVKTLARSGFFVLTHEAEEDELDEEDKIPGTPKPAELRKPVTSFTATRKIEFSKPVGLQGLVEDRARILELLKKAKQESEPSKA